MGQEKCHQFLESWDRGPAPSVLEGRRPVKTKTRTLPDHPKAGSSRGRSVGLLFSTASPCLSTSGQGQVCKAASHGCTLAQVVTQEEALFFSWVPVEGVRVTTLAGLPTGTHTLDPPSLLPLQLVTVLLDLHSLCTGQ